MDKSINYLPDGCVKMAQIADNMKYSRHYVNRECTVCDFHYCILCILTYAS